MPWILLLLLLCPFACEAQKRPVRKAAPPKATAQNTAWPLETIDIEGNHNYSREQILAVAGLKVGQMVAVKDIEAARNRLETSGAFSSVGWKYNPSADGKGYALAFQVVEAGPLFPVRFEDLGVPPEELLAVLKRSDPLFSPKIPGTQAILDRYAKTIEDYLAGRKRNDKVIGKLLPDEAGQLGVVFRPAAAAPAVARVTFTNNQVVPSAALQNAINAVAVGMPYKEARFRQVLDTSVRPLYEARGRIRVAFPEIRTEAEKGVQGLLVTVKVDEGASYSLGNVQVDGTEFPSAELVKVGDFKTGDLFNLDRIHAGVARIEKRMRHEGYMHVSSAIDRHIDDQKKTVDLAIHVNKGPRYVFGKLDVQGLDILSEPEIRKLWALKEGQPFNADYPDYFLSRIREDGIFDNLGETKAVQKPDDQNHTVDVTLIFRGEPPKPKKKEFPEQ